MSNNSIYENIRSRLITDLKELLKYGFWGAITTGFNLIVFFLLEAVGINYLIANIISYILAVFLNYILTKKFVFVSQSTKKDDRQFIKFLLIRVASLLIDSLLFYLLVSILHYNVTISRLVLSFLIIIATFGINKVYVFKYKVEVEK